MNGERDREIASYTTETVSSIYSYVFPLWKRGGTDTLQVQVPGREPRTSLS